jgi:hypothetical protein
VFLQSLNYGLERPYRLGRLRAGGKEEADTAACLRARVVEFLHSQDPQQKCLSKQPSFLYRSCFSFGARRNT